MYPLPIRLSLLVLAALITIGAARPGAAATTDEVKRIIVEESRQTLVPSSLALAVAQVESGLRPDRQGADGARGVFQLLPATADSLDTQPRELWNPRKNVRAGLKLLDGLLDRTEGRWDEALRAFASLRPDRNGVNPQRYVSDVLGWERRYAERLALQDAVNGRRRDVLMGHDDWGSAEKPASNGIVGRDTLPTREPIEQSEPEEPQVAELPPYLQPEDVNPDEDDDTDVPVEVRIYRGGKGTEIEVTVYEEEFETDPPAWRRPPMPPAFSYRPPPPPPPRLWKRPRQFSRPFGWRNTRLNRGSRWSPRRARQMKRQARRAIRRRNR